MSYGLPGDDPYYLSPEEEAKLENERIDDDAEIETLIRAQWKRDGVPSDYMNGGHRIVDAWQRSAFRAGRDIAPTARAALAAAEGLLDCKGVHGDSHYCSRCDNSIGRSNLAAIAAQDKEKGAAAAAPKSHDRG